MNSQGEVRLSRPEGELPSSKNCQLSRVGEITQILARVPEQLAVQQNGVSP